MSGVVIVQGPGLSTAMVVRLIARVGVAVPVPVVAIAGPPSPPEFAFEPVLTKQRFEDGHRNPCNPRQTMRTNKRPRSKKKGRR